MQCRGCYTDVKESYCTPCRKKLFDKSKIGSVLDFPAPTADNIIMYQEHSKQLSISGVQLKYSLRRAENDLVLCEQGGQYILKPIPPARQLANIEEVPENEHLTMQIAEQVFKISTAKNGLILFKDSEPAYLTRRFDVKDDGTKYQQEDFAQLTNRTSQTHGEAYKYDGSYEEIGVLIKQFVAAAMPALERFFQLVVFNYVISNGDAHLKNFSLIRDDNGEYQLTPAYDLLSTIIHTPQEADTALDLYPGDIDSPYYSKYGHYGRENFMELAKRLGIIPIRAERIIDSFGAKQNAIEALVEQSFLPEHLKNIYIKNAVEKLGRIKQTT
ncbi:type II toxin-antitoxin system HipA family toxin [Flavipsychrobacter stenotrophus]|uniref:Type II toxin-antitoxin system HipA family toxin n=1 Tax=Flavipsychrobacter stenotrophus TaxID=2077091 RepID=A0A2S7STJ9_9BACT|nr:HipA domain-containing protein [Flavipsychrobacter stenotrophus]PQJ09937.1 type II toxin-antitoxin system HipA family toxin [Flavipsychrobacter stenotrophus]